MDGIDGISYAPVHNSRTYGILRITSTIHPLGIRLDGELDRNGVPAVTAALASTAHRAARGDGSFHVDLSGLGFIDVSGLRVLVSAGLVAGGGSTGVIRVVAVSAAVRRILALTGWDAVPGWGQAPGGDQTPPASLNEVRLDIGEGSPLRVARNTGAVDGGG
ncbi:STAS domain-containing protein [Streptosporangium sp. OZ121]|uniref:STAS domain-containing protein n=1 Tax=unclassified Streptosporangium TaxID=2632669 RepID=UPI003F78F069